MPLSPGTTLGPYEIVARLGAGAMGEVYRARDSRLKRDVAIKLLSAERGGDPDRQAALVREAEALAALNHPHIAHVYEAGIADGQAFIAMEHVDGRSLDRLIERGRLPIETMLRYGSEIASALGHAHERGVVHRDLKAANVMVASDGRIKVLDFGIARRASAAVDEITRSQTSIEAAGGIAGTLPYMAPEVLGGEPAGPQSDIWSFGVLLYELAAGQRPFAGATGFAMSSAILHDPPTPLPGHVPPGLQGVIHRALAKDRSERYRSAREVQAALDTLRTAPGAPVRTAPARLRTGAVVVLAGVALGAAALGIRWALGRSGPPVLSEQRLLSTFPGAHRMATFSPDSRAIAFVEATDGVSQVWIKNLAGGSPIQVTSGQTGATKPRWSALGDQILFERPRAGIWTVPSLGGGERQLLAAGTSPNISADGRALVYERAGEIWVAGADGSGATRVEGVPRPSYSWPMAPAISPDGRLVAFFRAELGPNGDLWVVPASGGKARRLTFDVCEGGGPAWTPNGRHIVFSSARGGSHTLWRIRPSGGDPEPLTTGAGSDLEPALAPDARSLVYTNVRSEWRLQSHDPARARTSTLLTSRAEVLFPRVSPAGDRIAFFGRDDRGDVQVFTIGLDGTGLRAVTAGPGEINTMPRWAFDGRTIYYYEQYPKTRLRKIPVEGGQPSDVAPFVWERQQSAAPSPDDRRLAYTVHGPDGRDEGAFIRDLETGGETKLSVPLHDPRWSQDGRRLLGAWDAQAWMCQADSGECLAITKGDSPVWAADERRILLLRPRTRVEGEVWSVALDGSDERKVVNVGPFRVIDVAFDVAPGGQVIWAEFNQGRHELWHATVR
jgi:Tol biopolymer transport system component